MKNAINWKIFFFLLGLSLFSVLCVFPYVATIQADTLEKIGQPLSIILTAQLIQSAIMFSIMIFFGLYFAKKVNLKIPIIEAIFQQGDYRTIFKKVLTSSILLGIGVAILIYVIDVLFSYFGATISTHQNYAPAWQKLLAAVYGGTTEEILMRLFLMTFFIWLGTKIFKKVEPTKTLIIVSIVLAAVIFGLGHLPITEAITSLTPIIIIRAIILNGIGGVVFGWLFWKKGLESAMIAHFTTDVFLLTILPLLFK